MTKRVFIQTLAALAVTAATCGGKHTTGWAHRGTQGG